MCHIEHKIVGWAKLVVSVPKYNKIKIGKNYAFQMCPSKIFQSIDNIFGSVGCLILIGGSYYFGKCFSCVSC